MKIYPDTETLRDTDTERPKEYYGNSCLEKNCNQIFMKGPALTKEILEKVNAEIVPKKTYLFGYELKTKRVLLIAGLCTLLSVSLFGALMTWFTNTFDNFVLSQMVFSNNSASFNMWRKPTVKLIYNVYLFNYTNVEDYKNNVVDKFHLQEIGPYAYQESVERFDISFPTEDTISFREKRYLTFIPDLSKGNQNDRVVVPNLAVLTGSAFTKPQNYFNRLAFSALMSGMDQEPFLTIAVDSFITGYRDRLYSLARSFLPYDIPEEMGLLVTKIGESNERLTINTGKKDINRYAITETVNGRGQYDYFSEDICNSIEATDGAFHPPKKVQGKQPLYYLFPQVCRRMPLVFQKETTVLDGKVPAYQYTHPEDIFDSAAEKPENACYCSLDGAQCPLKGIFNVSSCTYGTPMFVSHPHFHRGDPSLVKPFTGLHPERTTYKSYFKVHPSMGFAMSARNLLQLNVQVQRAIGVSQVEMFDDGMILPIAWLEVIVDDKTLPQDAIDTIYLVTFTVPTIKLALKYGFLLTTIITLACLVIVLRRKSISARKMLPQRLIRTGHGYYEAR